MGSGPVIISARTRQREYVRLDGDDWADGLSSCRHMCCREGVDKAPKAPKNSFVPATSLVDSVHFSSNKSKKGQSATVKKSATPSVQKPEHKAVTEAVGPESRQTMRTYDKTPLKALRSLNRLHDNVTKGSMAPVATKKQPCYDFEQRRQPEMSFLDKDASAGRSSDNPSTDYDVDWMNDLPSPSALLGKPLENPTCLSEPTLVDHGRSSPDGLPSPFDLTCQNDATIGSHADNDSLEDSNLSQLSDEASDVEAAMIGLSDSVSMQQSTACQMSSQAEAFPDMLPPPSQHTPKLYHSRSFAADVSGTSKLFLSTDSPEKVEEQAHKRKAAAVDQNEHPPPPSRVTKRTKGGDERGQTRRQSPGTEKEANTPDPIVKAGQPAWVYEFDPAFITEWQDIVEFV